MGSGRCPLRGGTLEAVEIGHGLLCLGGGGKHGATVRLHNAESMAKVLGMVGVRLGHDAKPRTQKTRGRLGDNFFGCISVIAKPHAQLTVQSFFGRRPMRQFMRQGLEKRDRAAALVLTIEARLVGHVASGMWMVSVDGR